MNNTYDTNNTSNLVTPMFKFETGLDQLLLISRLGPLWGQSG